MFSIHNMSSIFIEFKQQEKNKLKKQKNKEMNNLGHLLLCPLSHPHLGIFTIALQGFLKVPRWIQYLKFNI